MMATGYERTDIPDLGLSRAIPSPTDFIRMEGCGTPRQGFLEWLYDHVMSAAGLP